MIIFLNIRQSGKGVLIVKAVLIIRSALYFADSKQISKLKILQAELMFSFSLEIKWLGSILFPN